MTAVYSRRALQPVRQLTHVQYECYNDGWVQQAYTATSVTVDLSPFECQDDGCVQQAYTVSTMACSLSPDDCHNDGRV